MRTSIIQKELIPSDCIGALPPPSNSTLSSSLKSRRNREEEERALRLPPVRRPGKERRELLSRGTLDLTFSLFGLEAERGGDGLR
jgi:hypothetical protein